MQRTVIQIARIRLADLARGDVINGQPEEEHGWFMVLTKRQLPNGDLIIGGDSSAHSVKGQPLDLVGVQVVKQVEVDAPQVPETIAEAG